MTTPKRSLIGASLIAILAAGAVEALAQDMAPVPPLGQPAPIQGAAPAVPPMNFVPADGGGQNLAAPASQLPPPEVMVPPPPQAQPVPPAMLPPPVLPSPQGVPMAPPGVAQGVPPMPQGVPMAPPGLAQGVPPMPQGVPMAPQAQPIPSVGTVDLKQIDEFADFNTQRTRLEHQLAVAQIQAKLKELHLSQVAAEEKLAEERAKREEARQKAKREQEEEARRKSEEEEARRKAQAEEEARRREQSAGQASAFGVGSRIAAPALPSGMVNVPKVPDLVPRQGVPPTPAKKDDAPPPPAQQQDNLAELPTVSLVSAANGPRRATLHLMFGQTKRFGVGEEIPGGYVISAITRDGVVKVVSTRTQNEYELRSGRGGPLIGGDAGGGAGGRAARR